MTKSRTSYKSIYQIRTSPSHLSSFYIKFLVLAVMMMTVCISQAQDTTKTIKPHSIRKATLFSVCIPGAGQAYNKKYWKIPIVYAGFGVFTYFIVVNTQEFNKFEEAYVYKVNGETYPIDNEYVDKYTVDQLKSGMDDYRHNRDISYILAAVWYALQVLDANVDAHFFDYDISDDLSLHWEPVIAPVSLHLPENNPTGITGVKVCFKF
jgi:hypothetical protein